MFKAIRSKTVSLLLIFSFILFYSPHLLKAEAVGKGNLIGFVYEKNGTTSLEGAIVKLKNVSTSRIYESSKTDKLGAFKIAGIDEGLYVVGISSKNGDFNLKVRIGIKANETAKVSFALKSEAEVKKALKSEAEVKKAEKPKIRKAKNLASFFKSPVGLTVIVVASVAIFYGVVSLIEAEPEASPFK